MNRATYHQGWLLPVGFGLALTAAGAGLGCGGSEASPPLPSPTVDAGGAESSAATGSGGASGPLGTGGGSVPAGTGGATPVAASGGAIGSGGRVGSGGSVGAGSGGAIARPTGTTLLTDDFEDGDTKGWLQDPSDTEGKWAVAAETGGSKALTESVVTASAVSWMVGGNVGWTDQRVEAKVRFTSFTDSGATIYLASRFVDFDNYYFVQMKVDGSVKIRKRIKGSTTDIVPFKTKVAVMPGESHVLGMAFQGSSLTIYLDGVAVATGTDPAVSHPAGGIALGAQKLVASFDDVKVTVP